MKLDSGSRLSRTHRECVNYNSLAAPQTNHHHIQTQHRCVVCRFRSLVSCPNLCGERASATFAPGADKAGTGTDRRHRIIIMLWLADRPIKSPYRRVADASRERVPKITMFEWFFAPPSHRFDAVIDGCVNVRRMARPPLKVVCIEALVRT